MIIPRLISRNDEELTRINLLIEQQLVHCVLLSEDKGFIDRSGIAGGMTVDGGSEGCVGVGGGGS